jgi:sulfoquinovosyltransferase
MPSESETLGFVVIEAMASGIPVVGVAAGGLLDLVIQGENGFISQPNPNMEEFTNYVTNLIENTEQRTKIGLRARKWAEGWSWETATSKLRNIQYRLAIDLHKSRDDGFRRRHYEDVEKALVDRYLEYRPDLC